MTDQLIHEMARQTGKWLRNDVPHHGWHCTRMIDLADENANILDVIGYGDICQMCEVTKIRFVHVMKHNQYPRELGCGCVCAGYMTDNLEEAQQREAKFKNRRELLGKPNTGKLRRKGWHQFRTSLAENFEFSKNDNWRDPVRNCRVKVAHTPEGWVARVYYDYRNLRYTTGPTADWRAATLDGMEKAEQQLSDKEWIAAEVAWQKAEKAEREQKSLERMRIIQQQRDAEDALRKQFEAEGMSPWDASAKAYEVMNPRWAELRKSLGD